MCTAFHKKVIKYNRDKKIKYIIIINLKHPNYLSTKSIIFMVVIKISHVIKNPDTSVHIYLITYKLFKKSVGEMCRSEAEST